MILRWSTEDGSAMKLFTQLSRAGQRQRLKALGRTALQHYQIKDATLAFVSETANTVFRVRQSSCQYMLRIHPAEGKSTAAIGDELAWLAALRCETTLTIPEPMPTIDGQLIQTVATPGVPNGRQVVLFRWLPGRLVGERYTPALVGQLGRVMAQLHDHASHFTLPTTSERDRTDWYRMADWRTLAPDGGTILSLDEQALCDRAAQHVANVIAQVDVGRDFGLIHSDLHFRNCLQHQGQLGVIDFDDCQFAPFSNDVAITLTYLDADPDYAALRTAFVAGYQQVRTLPDDHMVIDAFMVERGLRLILWVLSWPSIDYFPFGPATVSQALRRCRSYLARYA